jgi:hypothetical protein
LIGIADNVVGRTLLTVESVLRLWTEVINVARRASRLHSVSQSTTHRPRETSRPDRAEARAPENSSLPDGLSLSLPSPRTEPSPPQGNTRNEFKPVNWTRCPPESPTCACLKTDLSGKTEYQKQQ